MLSPELGSDYNIKIEKRLILSSEHTQDEDKPPFDDVVSGTLISEYTAERQERGERMIMAMTLSMSGMSCTRNQVRKSIARVNAGLLLYRKNMFDNKLIR